MRTIYIFLTLLFAFEASNAQVTPVNLLTENLKDPTNIDHKVPRFSWQLFQSDGKPILQQAYEIEVDTIIADSAKGLHYWSSGKVVSNRSLFVPYRGRELRSEKKYFWRVRIWDQQGKRSAWSKFSFWKMTFLSPEDWRAKWIAPGHPDLVNGPVALLRTQFTADKPVVEATAYITSYGFYEAEINGKKVGNAYLTPGWTSYHKRLQYQSYDVISLIKKNQNAIGISLGSGWFRSPLGPYYPRPNFYGKEPALLFQLIIRYQDGTERTIISDENWKSSTGAVSYAEIYNGCVVDARKEQKGWSEIGFEEKDWERVRLRTYPTSNLIATYNEPVKMHETFKPVKVILTSRGEHVIDFGQNLVGWVRINLKGKAGDSIKISHAEVLDKAGNFYTENLRAAKAQNVYVLSDNLPHLFEPQFSWQGFRYIKIEGVKEKLNPDDFSAVAIYSDMHPTGTFACSDPMLNQLQHNIQWGQKGNFLDVPTDCPQRDERLGWTGDAQVFSHTAAFNMNVHNFFSKWLKDLAADQYSSGSIPHIVPDVFTDGKNEVGGSSGWGDVSTIVPWDMYQTYDDPKILEDQYKSMKSWVSYIQKHSINDLWQSGDHFGDWLFYSVNNDRDGTSAITNKYLIAQCFYACSTQILIKTAKVLGRKADEQFYTELLRRIKAAFLREYVTPSGLVSSDTQTAYTLALKFDMLPVALRQQAADRLAKNIAKYGNHLTTGFLGTPYLCEVLSSFGYKDVAYTLLLQDTYPSWLYPIKQGATTIWERWDGIRTDGSFEESSMNSYNHYAYGAIGDWMYQHIAGIQSAAPGYKKIIIKPLIGGKLTWAEGRYDSPYGLIVSKWKISDNKLVLDVTIPQNTTAEIFVPDAKGINFQKFEVSAGNHHFSR